MKLDVSDIISNPGKPKAVEGHIDSDVFEISGFELKVFNAQPFEISLSMVDKKRLMVSFETSLSIEAPCDRCLEDVKLDFDINVEQSYKCESGELFMEDEDDEANCIEGSLIDIDGLVKEDILINWPLKILCRDDCKGLCPKCGINYNNATCNCDNTVLDPRMAQFLDVFNESN